MQGLNSQHKTAFNRATDDSEVRTVGSVAASLSPIDTSSDRYRNDWQTSPRANSGMVYHAIMTPIYREEIETLRDTLDVLSSHAQARSSYDLS